VTHASFYIGVARLLSRGQRIFSTRGISQVPTTLGFDETSEPRLSGFTETSEPRLGGFAETSEPRASE